jgi:uncharacterized protein involved in exopolysaccharide biosynthesis
MMPAAGSATSDAQVNWQDYLTVVIRRRWYFIVPTVVTVVLTMLVGMCLPRIYQAETVLLVQDPKITNPLIEGMAVNSPVEVRMRVVQEELLGWSSLSRLAQELGLDQGVSTPLEREQLIRGLQGSIMVTTKGGNLLKLSYTSEDPALAQRLLNKVTEIYILRSMENQTSEASTAIRVIDGEIDVYRKKLEESERALREFKELYAMEMPVAMSLNDQVIQLEVMLAQLLVENTEEHPTIIQVRRQIGEFKMRRNEELRRVVAQAILKSQNPEIYQDLAEQLESPEAAAGDPTVEEARQVYEAWVERLDSPAARQSQGNASVKIVTGQPGVQSTAPGQPGQQMASVVRDSGPMSLVLGPRQEQDLARLERDYEIHKTTYEQLKGRLEQAKITQRLGESDDGTKFKIIEPARLPLQPLFPNLWLFFFGSAVVGATLGIAAAFGAEYLDQSFQSPEEVQTALGIPVVGSISTIVTSEDVRVRQERMKRWVAWGSHATRARARVLDPVLSRVDKTLLRWGL